jgi:hypothetical protein
MLSVLAPGLGQLYNREYLRGIFWLIVTPGFWIGSGGALGWPFHLIAAYTAYRRACRPPASTAPSPMGASLRNSSGVTGVDGPWNSALKSSL